MGKYYSLQEISGKLKVPEYTLRYWMRTLGISGRKRHNRLYFDDRGVRYFIGIKTLIEKGYNLNSIKSLIKDEGRSVLLRSAEYSLSEDIQKEVSEALDILNKIKKILHEGRHVY